MRFVPLSALLLLPALASANPGKEDEVTPSVSPTLDLLPEGSTLTDVRVPRYDEEKRPASLLRAGLMTVVNKGHITGENVHLHVFESNGDTKLTVHLGSASYHRESGILEAKEIVNLTGDNYRTRGTGAIFELNSRRGFVSGPIQTLFATPPQKEDPKKPTAMNFSPNPLTALAAIGLTSIALAEPLPQLTKEELAKLDEQAKEVGGKLTAAKATLKHDTIRYEQLSDAAENSFRSFANSINRPKLLTIGTAEPVTEPAPLKGPEPIKEPEPGPKPKPADVTEINCEGGMYFDTDNNQVVYLEDIVVKKIDFTLTAGKELKIFLQEKPDKPDQPKEEDKPQEKPAEENKEEAKEEENAGFSDVDVIIGTGGIKLVRKDPKGRIMVVTADTATWDAKTGDIIVRGGFPRVQVGDSAIVSTAPGQYARIDSNGNGTFPGKWQTVLVNPKNGN